MNQMKRKNIEEQLRMIEKHLVNAEEYVAQNVNVEGTSWLHFEDWRGKSGHPVWMRNFMIPATIKQRAKKERALDKIDNKTKDKNVTRRRRHGAT